MFAFTAPTVLGSQLLAGNGVRTSTTTARPTGTTMAISNPSPSVPFLPKPKNLDESMIGYVGFDPFSITEAFDTKWMQESEIKHGRVCMLAFLGMLVQEFVHLPAPAFADPLATTAFFSVPKSGLAQIFLFCGMAEYVLHKGKMTYSDMHSDAATKPGHLGFNPLKMAITEQSQLQEIKNGRLAMCGVGGVIHSMLIYKVPIIAGLLNFPTFPGV